MGHCPSLPPRTPRYAFLEAWKNKKQKKKTSKTPACTFLGPLGCGTGALPVPARYSLNPLKLSAGVPFMRSRYKQAQSLPQVPVTLTTTLFTGLWVRSSEFRLNA